MSTADSTESNTLDYAPTSTRLVANIIDNFVIAISLVVTFLFLDTIPNPGSDYSQIVIIVTLYALWLPLAIFYFFFLEGIWTNQTLGKRFVNVRVVKENGSSANKSDAFIRNMIGLFGQLLGGLGLIVGGILIYTDERNQRLGDRLANTVVIRS